MSGVRGWKTRLKPLTRKQRAKRAERNERRGRSQKLARRKKVVPGG